MQIVFLLQILLSFYSYILRKVQILLSFYSYILSKVQILLSFYSYILSKVQILLSELLPCEGELSEGLKGQKPIPPGGY